MVLLGTAELSGLFTRCTGFAARLFGEAAEDDEPDHASEQLLAVAASITKAGEKLPPLSFQQVKSAELRHMSPETLPAVSLRC